MNTNHLPPQNVSNRQQDGKPSEQNGSEGSKHIFLRLLPVAAVFAVLALIIHYWLRSGAPDTNSKRPELLQSFPNEYYNASIVQILAHRDRYHGKKVQIEGYLHVRFEDSAIYLSKEDADYRMTRNGFWVSFDENSVPCDSISGPSQFHKKYVLIEGTFDKNGLGHMSAWQGTIKDIDRIFELVSEQQGSFGD